MVKNDITGNTYGKLTVLSFDRFEPKGKSFWKCRCSCGKEKIMRKDIIIKGTSSCGCNSGSKKLDITGQVFTRLTPLRIHYSDKNYRTFWLCECLCGTICSIRIDQLTKGITKSCGCLQKERVSTHGFCSSTASKAERKTYIIWGGILSRCYNPNQTGYEYYGGKGIKVQESWKEFTNFYNDMGLCPPDHSIERIDLNGDYTKENCIWIPLAEQAQNRTNTNYITVAGKTMCMAVACRLYNVPRSTASYKLSKGISPDLIFINN